MSREPWEWFVVAFGGFGVLVVLFDAWRYRRASRAVLRLLKHHGPMTGLELTRAGISRAHIYLILNRLETDGKVERCWPWYPAYEKQQAYKVTHDPQS